MQIALPRLSPLMQVVGASLIVSLLATVAIPLPFTPVPVIVQHIVLLSLASGLGRWGGALAAALFVLEGALGLPVFAGGHGGLGVLLGPSGGYIAGYVVGAGLAGWVGEKGSRPWAVFAGLIPIYAFGMLHLSHFVGWERVIPLGLTPFLLGDLLKCAVAATLIHRWR